MAIHDFSSDIPLSKDRPFCGGRPFPDQLRIIGLTGGIASGKSLIARQFEVLGAILLDADRAGHIALTLPAVVDELCQHWGEGILNKDGSVSRAEVAKRVFDPSTGSQERAFLERVTHPRIAELLAEQAERRAKSGQRIAVLDAALLFEAKWDRLCDVVIFVHSPQKVRLARALGRGWSKKDFMDRESAQLSVNLKRERADVVIDNSGSLDYVQTQVERFWRAQLGEA